jgi:multiple sugar transport system permease protein
MAGTALEHQAQQAAGAKPWTTTATVARPRAHRIRPGTAIRFAILSVFAIVWAMPVAWMLATSFKPEAQIVTFPPRWLPERLSDLTLANYENVLTVPRGIDLAQALRNSLIVAALGTILVVVIDVLAGYVFARMRFPLRNLLFAVVVASLIVPSEILLIPNYITVWKIGRLDLPLDLNTYLGLNTRMALIIPPAAGAFGVFLMRQFLLGIPGELEDAARLDGAGRFRILLDVILPLSRGPIAALAIFTFLGYWNEFTWPYVTINQADKMTMPVALIQFRADYWSEYGPQMAGTAISALPAVAVFLVAQRSIIRSITLTGVKG